MREGARDNKQSPKQILATLWLFPRFLFSTFSYVVSSNRANHPPSLPFFSECCNLLLSSILFSYILKIVGSSDHHNTLKKVSVTIPILCSKFVSDTIFDTFFKKVSDTIPILFRYSSCTKYARIPLKCGRK